MTKKVFAWNQISQYYNSGRTARLACVNRFEGHLFSHNDPSDSQRYRFLVNDKQYQYTATVRTSKHTTGVYSSSEHPRGSITIANRQITSVPRQLAVEGHTQSGARYAPAECVDTFVPSQIHIKYGKVVNSPKSG